MSRFVALGCFLAGAGFGFLVGKESSSGDVSAAEVSTPTTPASTQPAPPRATNGRFHSGLGWNDETRRNLYNMCTSNTVNALGYKACNSEVFCECAIREHERQGKTYDDFRDREFEIAAHAYHNSVGHPCTEVANKKCGGWRN
jgi:hypothetical protein